MLSVRCALRRAPRLLAGRSHLLHAPAPSARALRLLARASAPAEQRTAALHERRAFSVDLPRLPVGPAPVGPAPAAPSLAAVALGQPEASSHHTMAGVFSRLLKYGAFAVAGLCCWAWLSWRMYVSPHLREQSWRELLQSGVELSQRRIGDEIWLDGLGSSTDYFARPEAEALLRSATEQKDKGVLCVVGPPNSGKTALVREAFKDCKVAQVQLRRAGGSEIHSVHELAVVIQKALHSIELSTYAVGLVRPKSLSPFERSIMGERDFERRDFVLLLDDVRKTIAQYAADEGAGGQQQKEDSAGGREEHAGEAGGAGSAAPAAQAAACAEQQQASSRKPMVLLIDGLEVLSGLYATAEGRQALHDFADWMVRLAHEDGSTHVVITTRDALLFEKGVQSYSLMPQSQMMIIADLPKPAAMKLLSLRLPGLTQQQKERVWQALGGRVVDLLQWCKLMTCEGQGDTSHSLLGQMPLAFNMVQRASFPPEGAWTASEWKALAALLRHSKSGSVPFRQARGVVSAHGLHQLIKAGLITYLPCRAHAHGAQRLLESSYELRGGIVSMASPALDYVLRRQGGGRKRTLLRRLFG